MPRAAIIVGNAVWNIVEVDSFAGSPFELAPAQADTRIGDIWDGTTFIRPQSDISALKAEKNEEINAARLAANRSTFSFAGKLIACDELSRSDIDGVNGYVAITGELPPNWPGAWKAVDNTYVPISTVVVWRSFYSAMVAAGNAHFAKSQALKEALAAATTEAQIRAISW